ncbi:MAG: signal peptidase I [Verrucomicrobia bacterium]|nr:signal peptidase I [Verrucomicrobiota bacterium]
MNIRNLAASILLSVTTGGIGYGLNALREETETSFGGQYPPRYLGGCEMPIRRSRLRWFALVCGLFLLAAIFRHHFLFSFVVGNSMLPTFQTGDLLLVDKQAYRRSDPKRGDLVLARHRSDVIVKRVVGLPGEEVEITEGTLVVNGAPLREDYVAQNNLLFVGRGKIYPEKVALIGDNQNS